MSLTRDELRQDITDIIVPVVHEARRSIIKMINEDISATNKRIGNLSRRMDKRFKGVDRRFGSIDQRFENLEDKIEFTHKLLHVHVANPSAHSQR